MQHYVLFALRTLGFILSSMLVTVIVISGVIVMGTWQHNDYGTAAKASGAATGIVNWHDTLVTRLNTAIDGKPDPYKTSLAYGTNRYSFFEQDECKMGQGYVFTWGLLESQKYTGDDLRDQVRHILDTNGYTYATKVKRSDNSSTVRTTFTVKNATYSTEISMSNEKTQDIFGQSVSIITSRVDGQAACYPMTTLPKPHVELKYL